MATSTRTLLDSVVAGTMSPRQCAETMLAREEASSRPRWVPRFAWAVGIVLVALFLAPVLGAGRDRA
jgi:hypothetical protein